MKQQESEPISLVKHLFQTHQLTLCITKVDELNKQKMNFKDYQELQLFKGLSLFEQQKYDEGQQLFDSLIEEVQQNKGDKVEEIDVVLISLYTYYIQICCSIRAEKLNQQLLNTCEQYKQQKEQTNQYRLGIYYFGKGISSFVENHKDGLDLKCINLLIKANTLIEEYQQQIFISIGWIYFIKNQISKSIEWNEKLYALNPNYPSIASNLAILYTKIEKFDIAEKLYIEAENLCSNNIILLQNIAYFYSKKGNMEKEQEYYEKAYQQNPKSGLACQKYGRLLYNKGQTEEGIKIIKQGIECDPNYCGTYEELSNIAFQQRNIKETIYYLEKIIKLQPNNDYYLYSLGLLYQKLSIDYNKALQMYSQAIQIKHQSVYKIESHFNLTECLYILKDYSQSIEQQFNACNYENIPSSELNQGILKLCTVLNNCRFITNEKKNELINSQYGPIIMRFEQIANKIVDQKYKYMFLSKLDQYITILEMISYQKYIAQYLTFQSRLTYWDLYID